MNKYFWNLTSPYYKIVADDDFNPDGVACFGMDCTENGFKNGTVFGLLIGFASIGVVYVCKKIFKKVNN